MNSMKKINAYMQLLLLSVVLLSISCTGDFENMNRNPNEVTDGQMDALNYKIGTKFQSLQGLVVPVQEHMYQFNESLSGGPFGGYIGATVDSWLTKFETFNPSADWRKWPFANVITETYTPWRGIVTGTDDEVAVAFAKLLRVAIMHRVTDSYGPIPYSNLETNESITVKYDKQEEVYMKMFGELDEAIAAFAANTPLPAEAFSRYDRVYGGNIAQWLKYANSLKLRMAMRLSEVKPDVARTKAAEAIAAGVITANADNAAMHAAENDADLQRLGRPPRRRRHSLLHDRLRRPASRKDVPAQRQGRLRGHPHRHRRHEQIAGAGQVFEHDHYQFDALPVDQRGGGGFPQGRIRAALGNEGCRQGALRAGDPPLVRGQGRQGRRRLYRRQDQKTCGL